MLFGRKPRRLEGVLRQAAQSYEERKVPFLARLYSAAAHDAGVPTAQATYLLRTAETLTYRQFVVLAVFAHHDDHFRALAQASSRQAEGRARLDAATMLELDDLGTRRLIGMHQPNGTVAGLGEVWNTSGAVTEELGGVRLMPGGEVLVRLCGIASIPAAERVAFVEQLSGMRPEGPFEVPM